MVQCLVQCNDRCHCGQTNINQSLLQTWSTFSNVKRPLKDTTSWVRNIYDQYLMMSDHEKIFGCSTYNQITHLLITSVKDVIYQKRKQGKEMTIADVKRCVLKNLSILKAREILLNKTDLFEENWKIFITELRADIHTSNGWYTI